MRLFIKYLSALALGLIVMLGPSLGNALQKDASTKNLAWNGSFGGHSRDCPGPGSTCCYDCNVDVDQPVFINGAWHITGRTTGPFQETINGGTVVSSSDMGFIFPDGTSFEIDPSDFAGVPPLHVDLSNVQTDGAGNWSVDVQ